jgi:hypothetical protein
MLGDEGSQLISRSDPGLVGCRLIVSDPSLAVFGFIQLLTAYLLAWFGTKK